ncbi:hypothetical protein GCM10010341_86860 [Streptomyces noursei]|nr:hypothetical protein GCM10010341_86860 [Streptomyces noursei]
MQQIGCSVLSSLSSAPERCPYPDLSRTDSRGWYPRLSSTTTDAPEVNGQAQAIVHQRETVMQGGGAPRPDTIGRKPRPGSAAWPARSGRPRCRVGLLIDAYSTPSNGPVPGR